MGEPNCAISIKAKSLGYAELTIEKNGSALKMILDEKNLAIFMMECREALIGMKGGSLASEGD